MVAWSRLRNQQVDLYGPAIFSRPLGLTETALYWESAIDRATDILQRVTVETDLSQAAQIFSEENVKRTWLTVKRLHPMVGAYIREENPSSVHFVVDEERLSFLAPDEIVFKSLLLEQETQTLADEILNDPRTLSNELLVRLCIISLPRHHGSRSVRHNILFITAHCASDGISAITVVRSFLDILVQAEVPDLYLPKGDLGSRLAMLSAMEDLYPALKYSLSRQRWRAAIAKIIHLNREAALKGGFTLFRRLVHPAPAISRTLRIILSKDISTRILMCCRQARLTFGQALPILAQLAHARILHRLRSEGKMPNEEWEYRIRQPMHMTGPLNLRPYLDKGILGNGIAERVGVTISNFRITLPFVPVSRSLHPTTQPGFELLLSRARFFHRCHGVRRQMVAYLKHPLLMEFTSLLRPARIAKARNATLMWRKNSQLKSPGESHVSIVPTSGGDHIPQPPGGYVLANACSPVGRANLPPEYPSELQQSTSREASLRLISSLGDTRCRPAELYLTALTYAGEIQLLLFCDVRVYEEALAMQWLVEVRHAAEWYLGGEANTSKL